MLSMLVPGPRCSVDNAGSRAAAAQYKGQNPQTTAAAATD